MISGTFLDNEILLRNVLFKNWAEIYEEKNGMRKIRLACCYMTGILIVIYIMFLFTVFPSNAAEKYVIDEIVTTYQKEIYLEEKPSLAELQKSMPETLEVHVEGTEENKMIQTEWVYDGDYETTSEKEYLFVLKLPDGYGLKEEYQEIPCIKVIVSDAENSIQEQSETISEQNLEGEGTEENPYKLCTVGDFKYISSDMSAYYELQNDIDVGGVGWGSIGSSSAPFQGTLDGKGFAIKGIKYEKAGAFQGIFAATEQAVIKNLTVETTTDYVSGQSTEQYVGGLVRTGSGTIKNCTVRATLYGRYNSSGKYVNIGLIAGKFTGIIEECYGEGKIITADTVPRGGSLVGSFSGTMRNSYANVLLSLNSGSYVGGLVGTAHGNIEIQNCYMNSNWAGKAAFVGNKDKKTVTIENCYYNADRFTAEEKQGTGFTYSQMRKKESYAGFDFQDIWEISPSKNNGYPQLKGMKETKDIWERFVPHIKAMTDDSEKYPLRSLGTGACVVERDEKIYLKFDCGIKINKPKGIRILNNATEDEKETETEIVDECKLSITPKNGWDAKVAQYLILIEKDSISENYGENNGFPGIIDLDRYELHTLSQFYEGRGTEDNPYLVNTPYQLSCVRYRYADCYQLEDDLDLSTYNNGEWTGIGYITASGQEPVEFSGVFDGKGNMITGMRKMKEVPCNMNESAAGLFAYMKGGIIKNLGIYSEGIVAEMNGDGWDSQDCGVLVGEGDGKLERCFVKTEMEKKGTSESLNLGLLAGSFSGEIKECFAEGGLKGGTSYYSGLGTLAGGLVGNGVVNISDSYSHVDLSVKSATGGSAGGIFGGSKTAQITAKNCYYLGTIEKDMPGPDGGIAANGINHKIMDSYYAEDMLGTQGNSYGIKKTSEEMKQVETYEDWDFKSTWNMTGKDDYDYPKLSWFSYEYEKVALPVADKKGDIYYKQQKINLSTETEGAEIYYTTDGTRPDKENGMKYTGEITIGHYTQLKAIAIKEGMRASNVMKETYEFQVMPLTGLKLFDNVDVSVGDQGVLRFFPGNLKIEDTKIPLSLKQSTEPDGTYKLKLAIGIGKADWLDKKETWNQYEKLVEQGNKSRKIFEGLKKKYKGETVSFSEVKGFKACPKISVMGYYELQVDKNGYIVKNKGMLACDAKWSGSINKSFYTAIGPMYLSLGADGTLKGELGIQNEIIDNDYLNAILKWAGKLETELGASVEGGYGISKVATIGAKGKETFAVQIVPWGKADFSASASVHLYVAFVLDESYDLATYKETLWDSTKKESKETKVSPQEIMPALKIYSQLKPIDRSYAEHTSNWNGSPSKRKRAASAGAAESGRTEMILQTGVMPNTLPLIQQVGEDSVIVFQANDKERATLDSSVLMYSVYHGGAWSEPSPVWDTGTCDMYADLQMIGEELYVVWQKEKDRISADGANIENTLREMSEKSEICLATFDPLTGKFEGGKYITSNDKADMMPKLAYDGDKATVVWVQNNDNSMMQETGTNSILYSELTEGMAGEEKNLVECPGTVEEFAPFYKENNLNAGYITKSSNDSETNQVCVANHEGKSSAVSDDGVLASNVQYTDNVLYYWEDGIMQSYDVISGNTESISAGDSAIASNGKICINDGKTAVIWSAPNSENGTSSVYSSVKMEEGFSEPVVLYTTEGAISHLSSVLKADHSWQMIMNTADTGSKEETHSIIFSAKETAPEVQLESLIIDDCVKEGEDIPISYIVTNTSEEVINELELSVNTASRMSRREIIPVSIAPGETIFSTYSLDASGFSDVLETNISLNAVGQSSTGNTVTKVLAQTDLQVEAILEETDDDISITATVSNNSSIPANAVLSLYGETEQKELLESVELGEVSKGNDKTHTFILKKTDLKANKNNAYYLPVVVSSNKTDNDEDNNMVIKVAYRVSGDDKNDDKEHKNHDYRVIVTKATTSKNGNIVKKCVVCGNIESTTPIYYPADIRLSATDFTYNGKVQRPSVKVNGSDGKEISASNYTVSYSSGCKKIGHYAVKLTFKGNYSGTVTKTYNINPKGTKISKVKAAKKKAAVKWRKQTKNTKGYQIQYSMSKDFSKGVKTKTVSGNKKTSITLKKLKSKKTYYIRIRTYQNAAGGKCYSAWSKAKKVKIK